MSELIWVSPSSLNLFGECALCFWLEKVKKLKRAETPFASMGSGMDGVLKKYMQGYGDGMPDALRDSFPGGSHFMNRLELKPWMRWNTAPKYVDEARGIGLRGGVDDLLMVPDGDHYHIAPVDFKSRGYAPKTETKEFSRNQQNGYGLMLDNDGHTPYKLAYLVYWWPLEVRDVHPQGDSAFQFGWDVTPMECEPEKTIVLLAEMAACLKGPAPAASSSCKFCIYKNARIELAL